MGMDIRQLPQETQGGIWGVLGGQTFKRQGKLSNGWADWHQPWFTSADSSGNGHRLNTRRPSIPQRACRVGGWEGGLGVTNSKVLGGEAVIGWTDWHQLWYTSVDSSGNGHRLNTIRPTITQGGSLGGFIGSTIQKTGKCGQTA